MNPYKALALATLVTAGPATIAAERAIEKAIVVEASVDQAWDAWTTRQGITSFFAPEATVDPRPGGAFHILIDPGAPAGNRGADDMRFLAVQPKRMISFDWNAPPHLPEARAQRTVVIVRFEPLGEHTTRVTLHHTGWGDGGQWDQAYGYFDRAWGGVLASLARRFVSGPIDWTEWLRQLEQHRAAAVPAEGARKP